MEDFLNGCRWDAAGAGSSDLLERILSNIQMDALRDSSTIPVEQTVLAAVAMAGMSVEETATVLELERIAWFWCRYVCGSVQIDEDASVWPEVFRMM